MSELSSLRAEVAAAARAEDRADHEAQDLSETVERLEEELAALEDELRATGERQALRDAVLRREASRLDEPPAADADMPRVMAALRRSLSRPASLTVTTSRVTAAQVLESLSEGDVVVRDTEIEGDLDLTRIGAEALEPDCVRVYVPHALTLDGCVLRGALVLSNATKAAAMERALVCRRSWLVGGVQAAGAWLQDLSLADAGCGGPVSLTRARVWGDADLRRARFGAEATFAEARFEGRLLMDDAWCGSSLVLKGARCRGELSLTLLEGDVDADLRGLRCAQRLDLSHARWWGDVSLAGAEARVAIELAGVRAHSLDLPGSQLDRE